MKLKYSLFRKIFRFSIAIVVFTVIIGYIMNIIFLDKFYIYRKKQTILRLREEIKSKMNDKTALTNFIDEVRDKEGIDILIGNAENMRKGPPPMPRPVDEPQVFQVEPVRSSVVKIQATGNVKIRFQNSSDDSIKRRSSKMPRMKWKRNQFHITEIPHTNIKMLLYVEDIDDENTMTFVTSLSVMKTHKHEMNIFNVATTILAILLSTMIGWFFSKRITKNIEKLNSTAKKISILDFSQKSEIDSGDEIEELSKSIDIMSENLHNSIENLKAFASNASHELRTPITVISTHAQALLNGLAKTDKDKLNYYKAIIKKSNEMNEIVGNLLTISRLSSPGVHLNREEADVYDMIAGSREKYEMMELEKDIEWDIKIDHIKISCDPKLFRIAINNIIQNALKYSKEESKITVYKNDNELCFQNETNGAIKVDIGKLWEPFTRGDNATDKAIDGNGLGLSIVKKIIELNGYSCDIRSKDNIFTFVINLSCNKQQ